MAGLAVVLDANILIRFAIGRQVPRLLATYAATVERIGPRDPDDWPVLACALLLNCPIWTEDRDFFGVGVPIWTTARVEVYFTDPDPGAAQH